MSGLWDMIRRAYLLIPYSHAEAQFFLHIRKMFPWWAPGAIAFGIVPAGYIVVFAGLLIFGGFKWYDYEGWLAKIKAKGRKYSYYSFWTLYIIWLPLPWPRAAVLIWALLLRWTIKFQLKKRRRRIAWLSSLDKADLALFEGGEEWLERQRRIDECLKHFSIRKKHPEGRNNDAEHRMSSLR
ncbi:MAG: hypothetical protein K6T83_21140 [Alicyclobacillus sp.]|nr:hypothetical protein [Alicyclobacillus sp.]